MVQLTEIRFGPGYFQDRGAILVLADEEEKDLVSRGKAKRIETAERPSADKAEISTPSRKRNRR